MKTFNRKFRTSKMIGTYTLEGTVYSYYITEDLTDEELIQHKARAMAEEDFEYVHAVEAELMNRHGQFIKKQN